jgi:integrase
MLTAKKVERVKAPGRYHDGHGLHLQVRHAGNKSWLLRYERDGRERWLGLGPVHVVTLKQARERARAAKLLLLDGIDPIDHRRTERAKRLAAKAATITFREAAQRYYEQHERGWRNAKHRQQVFNTLRDYAFPVLGNMAVGEIDAQAVLRAIDPIWLSKTETASRVRGRIESVLDWATVRGYRTGDNPARWKGFLSEALPGRGQVAKVEHHPALPYRQVPAFMAALRAREGMAARALEFAILTAGRTNEIIGARWDEIDPVGKTWTVPAGRMKGHRKHRVPLSARAVELLDALPTEDRKGFIFVGPRAGSGLSNMSMTAVLRRMGYGHVTVHGFRSAFRDWCAEDTNFPREIAEFALAHVLGDKSEAAYWRADVLRKRKQLAEAWATFCARPAAAGATVVPLHEAARA